MAIFDRSGECALAKSGLRIVAMPSFQVLQYALGVSMARTPPANRPQRSLDCGAGISVLGSNAVSWPPHFCLAKVHQAGL